MMKALKALTAIAALAFGAVAFAAPSPAAEAPDALARRITQQVMAAARSDKAVKAGDLGHMQKLVETLILPHVDFERATALTVGRYWRQASAQQKKDLVAEFSALLVHTYAGALSQIGNQTVEFLPLRADPADTDVVVRFEVHQAHGGEPIRVSYRMYRSDDGWKVYDVNLLGAWLIQTYKGNFSAEIARGGIDGLIHALTAKNQALAANAAGRTS